MFYIWIKAFWTLEQQQLWKLYLSFCELEIKTLPHPMTLWHHQDQNLECYFHLLSPVTLLSHSALTLLSHSAATHPWAPPSSRQTWWCWCGTRSWGRRVRGWRNSGRCLCRWRWRWGCRWNRPARLTCSCCRSSPGDQRSDRRGCQSGWQGHRRCRSTEGSRGNILGCKIWIPHPTQFYDWFSQLPLTQYSIL